jgi:universal stress protein A
MYTNILIALELVGNEQYLIEAALKLAAPSANIQFLHACEIPIFPAYSYPGDMPFQLHEQEISDAKLKLSDLAKQYALPETGHRVVTGRAAIEIHRAADKWSTDLIVVGSHGRHGIQVLLGSTANAVLHSAQCDVLAVRMTEAA